MNRNGLLLMGAIVLSPSIVKSEQIFRTWANGISLDFEGVTAMSLLRHVNHTGKSDEPAD
jgi:hypothetical protein